jgi:hypothetical protein
MTTPTCPPGTVQVGITTVRYPEGDKTCVICKDCDPSQDPACATTWGVRFDYENSCTGEEFCRIRAFNVDSRGVPTIINTISGNGTCTTGAITIAVIVQFSDGSTLQVTVFSGFGASHYLSSYQMLYNIPAGSYPCGFFP